MKKLLFLAAAFSGFAFVVSDINAADRAERAARRAANNAARQARETAQRQHDILEQARKDAIQRIEDRKAAAALRIKDEANRQALLAAIRAANPVNNDQNQPAGQSYWQWLVEKTQTAGTTTQQLITENPKTSITIGGVTLTAGALALDYKIRGKNSVVSKVYHYFKNKSDKQALLEQKLADLKITTASN